MTEEKKYQLNSGPEFIRAAALEAVKFLSGQVLEWAKDVGDGLVPPTILKGFEGFKTNIVAGRL